MADHTPTPWVIPEGDQNDFIVCAGDDPAKPGEILFVLHKPLGRRSVAVDQQIGANTAFLVKAANSHETLATALDNAQSLLAMIWQVGPQATVWEAEEIRQLMSVQMAENRAALQEAGR